MKKTYTKPLMEAMKIQTTHLLMDSIAVDPSKTTDTQLGRRGGNNWDDDEEEEY